MNQRLIRYLPRWLAGLSVLVLARGITAAQGPAVSLDRIFEGWQKRQERVQRIRYTVVGQSIVPKGSQPDGFGNPVPNNPPQDVPCDQNITFLLDMARQRFRMELESGVYMVGAKAVAPRVSVTTFDGRDMMCAMPRDKNTSSVHTPAPLDPDLMVSRNYKKYHPLTTVVAYYQSPLLFAHGFLPRYIEMPTFNGALDPDDFIVRGQVTRDGRRLTIVKTFPFRESTETSWDEFWVDTGRDFIVVRQLAYSNDKPIIDLDITYQQTNVGWLPEHWTGTTRSPAGKVINVTHQRVKEFVIDPAANDADYRLEARPGMVVMENDYPDPKDVKAGPGFERKMFRVADSGSWMEIDAGTRLPGEQQRSWLRRHWLALTIGLFAALLLGAGWLWAVWRKRRRPPIQPAMPPA
jgi:hypothetical protein